MTPTSAGKITLDAQELAAETTLEVIIKRKSRTMLRLSLARSILWLAKVVGGFDGYIIVHVRNI